jgi:TRAP-type C4-dicarboxylate transport system permease small subunit
MVDKFINALSVWLCWVSAACIVGMMLLTSSDVILRYLGYPIKGTYDVVGLLGALVVALPIARTQILNRHVSMEFMEQRQSRMARGIAQVITFAFSFGTYLLLSWQLTVLAGKLRSIGRVSDTVEIPLFPFVYAIAFGCMLMCLVLLMQSYRFFRPAKELATMDISSVRQNSE